MPVNRDMLYYIRLKISQQQGSVDQKVNLAMQSAI